MKIVRFMVLPALVAAALAVSACSAAGTGTAASPAAPALGAASGSQAPATPPTIRLVSPVAGAEVPAGELTVRIEVADLEFVMPSNTNVAGQGHVHFTLDDKPFQMSAEPQYTFKDVAAGPHRLKAQLVQNNTKPFDPPVEQEIEFTAK